jgi:hypothetical protein
MFSIIEHQGMSTTSHPLRGLKRQSNIGKGEERLELPYIDG